MSLFAFDGQFARQRAAPAVFNHVAQFVHGGRFADDAVVDKLVTRFQHIDDFGRTIQCVALFVGSNQECNAALMVGMFGNEAFAGGNEAGDAGFRVRRAASV